MKTKKRTTKVPSTIRPTHKFTERERAAYIEWQTPDASAPADYLTPHETGELITELLDGSVSPHASMHAAQVLNERKGVRRLANRMTPPLRVALTAAAAMVIEDCGNNMDDETIDKLNEVLDAVETCWLDPEPPESWKVNTDTEGDCSIDVPKFIAGVRADAAAMAASRDERKPETLDEFYRIAFNNGGREQADRALQMVRAVGALGKLRVTEGIVHVVDRAGYERLIRGIGRPFYCHDPYCEGESEHFSWDKLEEMDCTEDGAVAVVVRRQERRDGSWVTAIAVCGKPTGITERLAKIDEERQYVVVESEVAP
jgi:hypothetical protein